MPPDEGSRLPPTVRRLRFGNYRGFERAQELPIRPLTLLFGRNGAGKSSVARMPALLERALLGRGENLAQILRDPIAGNPMELVTGGLGGELRLGVDLDMAGALWRFDAELLFLPGTHASRLAPSVSVRRWTISALDGTGYLTLVAGNTPGEPDDWRISPGEPSGGDIKGAVVVPLLRSPSVRWRGLVPQLDIGGEFDGARRGFLKGTDALRDLRVVSLAQLRKAPAGVSPLPPQDVVDVAFDGGSAGDVLAADQIFGSGALVATVSEWFSQHLGWRLDVEVSARPDAPTDGSYLLKLRRDGLSTSVPIASHGSGMGQVLPVVVRCAAIAAGRTQASIYTFEEPETHLHPAAHGGLADLFLSTARAAAAPLVVETHSEVLLLRVLRRIAEGACSADKVALYWIDDQRGPAQARLLEIQADGWVDGWPEGVFAEDAAENRAIARAIKDPA